MRTRPKMSRNWRKQILPNPPKDKKVFVKLFVWLITVDMHTLNNFVKMIKLGDSTETCKGTGYFSNNSKFYFQIFQLLVQNQDSVGFAISQFGLIHFQKPPPELYQQRRRSIPGRINTPNPINHPHQQPRRIITKV